MSYGIKLSTVLDSTRALQLSEIERYWPDWYRRDDRAPILLPKRLAHDGVHLVTVRAMDEVLGVRS